MSDLDIFIQWSVLIVVSVFLMIRKQLTIFHPSSIYLAFHAIVFCIRPTLVKYYDFDVAFKYMRLNPTPEILRQTLYITSIALIVFVISFCVATNMRGAQEMGRPIEITKRMRKAFLYAITPLVPIAMYSIFGTTMVGERVGGVFVMSEEGSTGYMLDFQQVLIPISILSIVLFRWKWWSFLPFLVYVYFRMTQGWARWTIILPFLAIILFHCWVNRKNLPSWLFFIPLPFLLILFNELSHSRSFFRNLVENIGQDNLPIKRVDSVSDTQFAFQNDWDTLDFANFDYLVYIVNSVPDKTKTYSYGVQHLQLFTEPIPRKLWKGKPFGPPIKYFDLNDYGNFYGLTVSIIGDGWITGGWTGVMLNVSIIGFLLGKLYNWFIRNQHNIFIVSIFLIINSVLLQLFRDGGIVSIMKFILFTLLPIIMWWGMYSWMESSSEDDS